MSENISVTSQAPTWDIGSGEPVPMSRWGQDHWSTFAYVETRDVDHAGMLHHDHMRVDVARHPMFASARRHPLAPTGRVYPTRLKSVEPDAEGRWGVVDLADHDDYDCLNDAIRLGLVRVEMPTAADGNRFVNAHGKPVTDPEGELIRPSFVTGLDEWLLMAAASFRLTDAGRDIAAQARAHLAARATKLHQFMPRNA